MIGGKIKTRNVMIWIPTEIRDTSYIVSVDRKERHKRARQNLVMTGWMIGFMQKRLPEGSCIIR